MSSSSSRAKSQSYFAPMASSRSSTLSLPPVLAASRNSSGSSASISASGGGGGGGADNIKVCIRMRPLSVRESRVERSEPVWRLQRGAIESVLEQRAGARATEFEFDRVFAPEEDTSDVFETSARAIVDGVLEGVNGTVFAYGQTSSGKTYTITGTEASPGIIPRAVDRIFELIAADTRREFVLRMSFMEIYNECVNDLFDPCKKNLQVWDTDGRGISVAGITEELAMGRAQVLKRIEAGLALRQIGRTNMNETSSRSHTVFQMIVESRAIAPGGAAVGSGGLPPRQAAAPAQSQGTLVANLFLVDLAGSERLAKTQAVGERAREGVLINKSLLTLGKIINTLSKGRSNEHLPFRDSKLTRILRPSLEGNARISIICACSPALINYDETISTLQFASRAKLVRTKARVNEVVDDKALIHKLKQEIELLKKQLEEAKRVALAARKSSKHSALSMASVDSASSSLEQQPAQSPPGPDGAAPGAAGSSLPPSALASASASDHRSSSSSRGAASSAPRPARDRVRTGGSSATEDDNDNDDETVVDGDGDGDDDDDDDDGGGSSGNNAAYDAANADVLELQDKINRLNRFIVSSSGLASRAQEEAERRLDQVTSMQAELEILRSVNQSKDKRFDGALDQMNTLERMLNEKKTQCRVYEGEIMALMAQVRDKDARIAELAQALEAAQQRAGGDAAAHKQRADELAARLESAQRDIKRLTVANSAAVGSLPSRMSALSFSGGAPPALDAGAENGGADSDEQPASERALSAIDNASVRAAVLACRQGAATELQLGWQCLGDEGLKKLAPFLGALAGVTRLNVEWNRVGPPSLPTLCQSLRTMRSLAVLELGGNCLGDAGVEVLADALSSMTALERLDLKWNRIRDAGIVRLCGAVNACVQLRTLDVAKNWFGDAAADSLLGLINRNGLLEALHLGGTRFTDASIAQFRELMRHRDTPITVSLWGTKISASLLDQLETYCALRSRETGVALVLVKTEPAAPAKSPR